MSWLRRWFKKMGTNKDEIRQRNLELERRVEERTHQLKQANQDLESFAYSVSHDLRTPLTLMTGFVKVLEDKLQGKLDDEEKHYLNLIKRNAIKMGELIEDVLAFSRFGRKAMEMEELDMEKMVAALRQDMKLLAPQRHIRWIVKPLAPSHGDKLMVEEVLNNLVGNAVKFTREKVPAVIEIGSWREGDQNVYYVKDNGIGFDMHQVHKLFQVFQRLHPPDQYEGSGAGLAIVQRIIQRHNGRVWAEGKPGEGATFYFTLPRLREKSEAA